MMGKTVVAGTHITVELIIGENGCRWNYWANNL